jgi:protein SCO1/2
MHYDFLARIRIYLSILLLNLIISLLPNSLLDTFAIAAETPKQLEGVGITEHLGASLPIDEFRFTDEAGQQVTLSQYFKSKRPVILALVYYECPNLCNLVLNGLMDSLKKMDWTTGNEFELVAVSINPKETPELATKKRDTYLASYERPGSEKGWHFLTGEESQIRSLASQVGFGYRYDETEKQYAHAAALFILTPEGKISRTLYGINFVNQNLRLALVEASHGKIGTVMDKVLLFCFHFDPNRNSYTLKMWRIVQIVLAFQAIALAGFLYYLWRRDRLKSGGSNNSIQNKSIN